MIVGGYKRMFKVDKRYAKANVQKTIRFTEQLYNDLNNIATREDISFNTLILQCCSYALDNMNKKEYENRNHEED